MGSLRGLGIRPVDVGLTALVMAAVEINVATGGGPGAAPLNAKAYLAGAALVVPVLLRHRWPVRVLAACSVLLLLYYSFDRRDISPAPLLCLPLYDAAVAGALATAIVIPAIYMTVGLFVVGASTHASILNLTQDFLPSAVVLMLAIMLGEVVRSRRALAAETAVRLRLAAEERDTEAARRVTEERLRIARELHDTVAHAMATITVQAGSALHRLGVAPDGQGADGQGAQRRPGPPGAAGTAGGAGTAGAAGTAGTADMATLRDALVAIRDTSKTALADMRATLGQLRGDAADVDGAETRAGGLHRLDALAEAVRAAGAGVTVTVEGTPVALPAEVDHAAYRILQESLTNVLRHAGPGASADVGLRYEAGSLTIQVTDDGNGPGNDVGPSGGGGHGITGMRERASAVGGELLAGPQKGGGYQVCARLPAVARPDGAQPDSARPDSAQPDSAQPDSAQPDSNGVPA